MVTSEIDGAHRLPIYLQTFTDKVQKVLLDVGGQSIGNIIKPSSAKRYDHRLFQCVNRN